MFFLTKSADEETSRKWVICFYLNLNLKKFLGKITSKERESIPHWTVGSPGKVFGVYKIKEVFKFSARKLGRFRFKQQNIPYQQLHFLPFSDLQLVQFGNLKYPDIQGHSKVLERKWNRNVDTSSSQILNLKRKNYRKYSLCPIRSPINDPSKKPVASIRIFMVT